MALWVSKGADVLEGTSWILSVFICMYRESCPEFMYTSTISSLYFPPSSFITQRVCLFVLAGSFPVIPPFPTLYSFYQSPAATWIEAYLDYMKVLLLKNRPKKCQEHCFETIFFVCYFIATLGDISLAIRLLLANSSNTVSPPQSSLAQICSVFSRHFQNSIKNSNNREGLGFSPDLFKLSKSRCPYFSCEIKTIHRRKNNVEERLPQEVHN